MLIRYGINKYDNYFFFNVHEFRDIVKQIEHLLENIQILILLSENRVFKERTVFFWLK